MADFPQFFVVVFSRTEANEIQIGAAMRALNERHAASLGSHFVGDGQGAIAFSRSGDRSVARGENVKILAQFGDALPDGPNIWAPGTPGSASVRANPLAKKRPVTNALRIARSRIVSFAARQRQFLQERSRLSHAMASLVTVAFAVSGGSLVALAKGAQREARLVEMARPACSHSDIENKTLRWLVRHELHAGLSKEHVLYAVASLCQANSREV